MMQFLDAGSHCSSLVALSATDRAHTTYHTPLPADLRHILKSPILYRAELCMFFLKCTCPIVFLSSVNGCFIFAFTWPTYLGHSVDVSPSLSYHPVHHLYAQRNRDHCLPPPPPAPWSIISHLDYLIAFSLFCLLKFCTCCPLAL